MSHPAMPVQRDPGRLVRRWWPAALAVVVALGIAAVQGEFSPDAVSTWLLPVLAGAYLVIGAFRGVLRRPGVLGLQLAALVVLGVLTAAAFVVAPEVARYLVAAGWAGHAFWDFVHHRDIGRHPGAGIVPRWYAEACIVIDLVVAGAVLAAP